MPDSDPSTTLAEAKRIADGLAIRMPHPGRPRLLFLGGPAAEAYWNYFTPARIPSLLAAIEAVLEETADWKKTSAILDRRAERAADSGRLSGPATSALLSGRAQAYLDCASAVRQIITRALTGQEPADG